jgi:hypothetical protein
MNKLCVLALLAAPLAALAQVSTTNLNRVDVSGSSLQPPTRYDVSQACPSMQQTLTENLGWFSAHGDLPRETRVTFDVDAQGGVALKSTTMPRDQGEFRQALRHTLQRVECEPARLGLQTYAFKLVFVDEATRAAGGARLALVEQKP